MNATEARFERCVLQFLKAAGEIDHWEYEQLKFRLADKTWYTPDFTVYRTDGLIELIDVKGSGGWEQHTRIKMKACAEKFSRFVWCGQTESKGRKGVFTREEF